MIPQKTVKYLVAFNIWWYLLTLGNELYKVRKTSLTHRKWWSPEMLLLLMVPLSAYRALSRHGKVNGDEKPCFVSKALICCVSPFPAHPSARDLLHRQPRAGPAGCFSAQLLWQRVGGVGNSEQQVLVRATHRAPDPARGPLRENHSRRQHWRDRAPWKR